MIFYFSGTGNSLQVARTLADRLNDRLIPMNNKDLSEPYIVGADERIGWVFPIYAWGPPPVVLDFIRQIHLNVSRTVYSYFVCTCGDDMGRAERILTHALKEKGIHLSAGYALQMPNTYVCLPGFDTDKDEIAYQKKAHADTLLPSIAETICNKETAPFALIPGSFPWFKTYVLRPLFNRFMLSDRYFRTQPDCIHCGHCATACPVSNIQMKDGIPRWNGNCAGCLACYHTCPVHAIQFGKMTRNKGQYLFRKLF